MQKEFEKQEKMRTMDEEHRKKYEEDLKLQQQKHNNHERIHHPGNKAQLEEGELNCSKILEEDCKIVKYCDYSVGETRSYGCC